MKVQYKNIKNTFLREVEFSHETLSIKLKDGGLWKYGEKSDNLKGTVPTLDNANGAIPFAGKELWNLQSHFDSIARDYSIFAKTDFMSV